MDGFSNTHFMGKSFFNNLEETNDEDLFFAEIKEADIADLSMIDPEGIIVIPFSSTMNFQAPCDGFILFKGNTIAANLCSSKDVELINEYWFSASYSANVHPIPKGYKCKYKSGATANSAVKFLPMKGAQNA